MRKPNAVLRSLCGVLDGLIIMLPIQLIMLGIFGVSAGQADLLFKFLFAVYGALLTEYWGHTVGKYFGRLKCVDVSGAKAPMLYVGLRELVKSLYIVPVFGWIACAVSLIMMLTREDGRMLHDFAGNTRVVYQFDVQKKEGAGDESE